MNRGLRCDCRVDFLPGLAYHLPRSVDGQNFLRGQASNPHVLLQFVAEFQVVPEFQVVAVVVLLRVRGSAGRDYVVAHVAHVGRRSVSASDGVHHSEFGGVVRRLASRRHRLPRRWFRSKILPQDDHSAVDRSGGAGVFLLAGMMPVIHASPLGEEIAAARFVGVAKKRGCANLLWMMMRASPVNSPEVAGGRGN